MGGDVGSVPLDELAGQIERFGAHAYVLTVDARSRPRATSVTVRWEHGRLAFAAGRRTADAVRANAQLALLWPAPRAGGHALLVDGRGALEGGGAGAPSVLVQPTSAVLHATGRRGPAGERR